MHETQFLCRNTADSLLFTIVSIGFISEHITIYRGTSDYEHYYYECVLSFFFLHRNMNINDERHTVSEKKKKHNFTFENAYERLLRES